MRRLTLLTYDYVPDVVERRAPHREAHLALLGRLLDEGRLVMAGVVGDPPHGALLIVDSAETAEELVAADPYVANGIVTGHRIEPWAVAVG